MNILNRILVACSLGLLLCGFSSCDKEDIPYEPMTASNWSDEVHLTIVDEQGRDLVADSTFLRSLSFQGNESRRPRRVEVEKANRGNLLVVHTDTPNWKKHKGLQDPVALLNTSFSVSVAGKSIDVQVVYRSTYNPATPDMLGNGSLFPIEAEVANQKYSIPVDKIYTGVRVTLPFLYKDGRLTPIKP